MSTTADQVRIPVYVDCDPGIDDAVALALLLRSERISVEGVGTVAGNVDAYSGARNAAGLLHLAGRSDIPVAVGATGPLGGQFTGGFPDVHGSDGLGGVALPGAGATGSRGHAIDQLLMLARAHAGRLRVIAVGPLTNLALALESEPALPDLVDEVYVMVGAFEVPGNVTPFAEANFWCDPEAADQVLRSELPVTVVPLDVTMKHLLTRTDMEVLACSPDGLARALAEMLVFYGTKYQAQLGDVLTPLHDPLTAALAANMIVIADEVTVPVRVETSGDARGALLRSSEHTRQTRIVRAVQDDAASVILRNILIGESARA